MRNWLWLLPAAVLARPTNLQEASSSSLTKFWTGAVTGVETTLAFMGYYNDDYQEEWAALKEPTTMQVACLGLGRTGTTSLALAMEYLGYTVIHDDEHVALRDLYHQEESGEITWDEFHEVAAQRGYNMTFKSGIDYLKEHPEIKAILTLRDTADKYVDSWLAAVDFVNVLQQRPFRWMKTAQDLLPSFLEEYMDAPTGGSPELFLDRSTLRNFYNEHMQDVRDTIPAQRLLEFNVKQGWGPLCEFLGKPIPDIPFPHVHDRTKLMGEQYVLKLITWTWPILVALPLALLYFLLRSVWSIQFKFKFKIA